MLRSLMATLSVIGNVKNSECNIEALFNIKNVQIVLFLTKESNSKEDFYWRTFLSHSKVDHLLSKIIYKALRVENDR